MSPVESQTVALPKVLAGNAEVLGVSAKQILGD
jgi:hypothetical protein